MTWGIKSAKLPPINGRSRVSPNDTENIMKMIIAMMGVFALGLGFAAADKDTDAKAKTYEVAMTGVT